MKNFLKPSWLKIVLFVLLITAVTFIPKTDSLCSMTINNGVVCSEVPVRGLGYPLFYGAIFDGGDGKIEGILPMNFIINIIGYYLLASGIVFVVGRRKNSSHQ